MNEESRVAVRRCETDVFGCADFSQFVLKKIAVQMTIWDR
jgi:hypothetical protein